MKKLFLLKLVLALSISSLSQLAFSESGAVDVESLRDGYAVENMSEKADRKKVPTDFQNFESAYKQQPPLIRHFIEGFKITLQLNDCLDCHENHFEDEKGNVLDEINNWYYFCTQCHVSQVTDEPLRDNTFEPVSE
ncbi:nitrate reductase cytochrome c-type subunit [Candidatus Marithioploca araucensis]|uniref:Periplasmic nitrate reductase, electron transfer subunit n=1 Tax=Candidatus Marithioploca araucensis TaxID=70273 RepID=A0ABT7VQY1_9GAMM|nr:nitrate reductase cytochrome c-type subunit [Candidatus Marithioploca araucensis]